MNLSNDISVETVQIDCNEPDWEIALKKVIQEGKEAELFNFDYKADGEICEILAISPAMKFVFDPKAHAGFLKRRA